MAKTGKPSQRAFNRYSSSSHKPRPSGSKANAAGYAKRQAKKAKTLHGLSASDVYEFAPEATRRAKVKLDLDPEEAREFGVGLDGEGSDDERREALRARLIGENVEDEMIDSEDDEEIDSDAAFDESDEDRFAGFFSAKGKPKKPTKKKQQLRLPEVNLDEDDVDMEEDAEDDKAGSEDSDEEDLDGIDEEELVDVLDVLDGRAKMDSDSEDEAPSRHPSSSKLPQPPLSQDHDLEEDEEDAFKSPFAEEGEDGADEEEEEDEDEEDSEDEEEAAEVEEEAILASDDEDVPEALVELQTFISGLDPSSKKRKAPDGDDAASAANAGQERRKQRRVLPKERTETGAENEFRVPNSGAKLQLDDLLAPLASSSAGLQSLKSSTKVLKPSANSKTKTLSAPLPQRAQERLDRQAAYEQTKEEVDKWSETMKRIRDAEHLSFPLQAQPTGRVSNLELAAKFKPSTDLESSIDNLLKSAKLRDQDILHTEDSMLAANKLSVEEVQQRRAELRKMRDLMFRAEIKARRVAKIKSKAYRKIKRKQREKMGNMDEDGDVLASDDEEARMKREVERARERATLRHKHTGKWAKQMKGREMFDEDSGRQEIEEMLDRGEKLRRRIRGVGSDEEEEEEESDEGGDEDEDIEAIRTKAFEELKQIDGEAEEDDGDGKKKGVFQMKFMKEAMARKQHETEKMVDDFVRELGDMDEEAAEMQPADAENGPLSSRTGGRVAYHPGATTQQPQTRVRVNTGASDTSSVTLKSTDFLSPPPISSPEDGLRTSVPLPEESNVNPWLVRDPDSSATAKVARKANDVVVSKDSTTMTKSKNKMKKMARKLEVEKQKRKDDAVVEITQDNLLILGESASAPSAVAKKQTVKVVAPDADEDDVGSEVEAQEQALQAKDSNRGGVKAFEQRDLVALAFAGDNVVQQFEEAKKREMAADAPKEVDTTLAGWGSWGGSGVQKAPPKPRNIKKVAGIDPTTRADYGKTNVIISEKRDKKAAKYLVKDLPYPYTSKAQFERTMETPLGKEWNTRLAFQRGTLPRVTTKPGMIINPLEKLS